MDTLMDEKHKYEHHGIVGQHVEHPAHGHLGIRPIPGKLHVVTCMFNPMRYRARYRNYWAFQKHCADAGVQLYTVELALGKREFEVTQKSDPMDLQLRTWTELWHKESLLNIGVQMLPSDWEYVAWIDADVCFTRPNWAQETLHLLQHYQVLQMFSHAQDLGPDHEPLFTTPGFVYQWQHSRPLAHTDEFLKWGRVDASGQPYPYYPHPGHPMFGHPGFAWACRREAFDALGGLIDWAILGSGDYHMACALIGMVDRSLHPELHTRYVEMCQEWQARATENIKQNIGYMPGTVNHSWHGRKSDRLYNKRWRALIAAKFNPDTDLKRDWQRIWQLTGRNTLLRDALRDYQRVRNEDSCEVVANVAA